MLSASTKNRSILDACRRTCAVALFVEVLKQKRMIAVVAGGVHSLRAGVASGGSFA